MIDPNSANPVAQLNQIPPRKRQFFGMNVGSASMLLIFVILCLVSFAALSIVSANADRKLTTKVADRTSAYYQACEQAEEALAEIDGVLLNQYLCSENADEYFAAVGHTKSYAIPITGNQTLLVHIEIIYPEADSDNFYSITDWCVYSE